MKQEQLEAITYSQYTAWLCDVYLKIPKDLGFLTYDKAMELAKKERVLRRKEMKSIIQKIPSSISSPSSYYFGEKILNKILINEMQ